MRAESYVHLAEDYFRLRRFTESIEFAIMAAERSHVVHDTVLAVEAYALLGRACLESGENEKGENALKNALALCSDAALMSRRNELLMYLGEYHGDRGRLLEGRRELMEALDYFEDIGDDIFAHRCRYELALNFGRSNRPMDALQYTDAILEEEPNAVDALILSSVMLRRIGMLDSSYHRALRSASLRGPLASPRLLSRAHENLGDVLYAMEDYQGAAEQFRQAIEYYSRDSTLVYPALLHYKLATSFPDGEVVDKKIMLEIMGKANEEFIINLCNYRLASAYLDSGAEGKTRESLEAILGSDDDRTSRWLKWRAAYAMVKISGYGQKVYFHTLADSLYVSYPPEPEFIRKEYRLPASIGDLYRDAASLCLESKDLSAAADYFEKAWLCEISGAHMSGAYFDSLETNLLDFYMEHERDSSGGDFEVVKQLFFDGDVAYGTLWGKAPATFDEFRKTLKGTQCALRYYSFPESLVIFYIDSDTIAYKSIEVAGADLEEASMRFKEALRLSTTADSMLEYWYTVLVAPFEELIEEREEMLIVPNGALASFPLDALKRPFADYLGETHWIVQSVQLPVEFPSDLSGRLRPCAVDENITRELEIINGVVEVLGGCREYDGGYIEFSHGDLPVNKEDQNVVFLCNLNPAYSDERPKDFYLNALRLARDGREGILQTLWLIPDQPLSYYYWVFLRGMMAGSGFEKSYRSGSSYLFGRFRGIPYYWAFTTPYHLN
jgi:tetratricopeptide (TPR) repeat protein